MNLTRLSSYPLIASLSLVGFVALTQAEKASGFASNVVLQTQEQAAVWERYAAEDEEFSVMMPELPGVMPRQSCLDVFCKTKRIEKVYAAYAEGGVYSVTSYQNPKHRQPFDAIINESLRSFEGEPEVISQGAVKLKGFEGKKYLITSKNGYDRVVIFYLTRDHVYEVAAVNDKSDDPAAKKFFDSFALGDKTGKDIGKGARLENFPIPTPSTPLPAAKDAQGAKESQPRSVWMPKEVMRKAFIVFKPSPEYTEEARRNVVTGTVVLRMILHASGKVASIHAISGLPYGLTDKAIAAARKLYFIPAVKDGKHVSQYIQVEYNFGIY